MSVLELGEWLPDQPDLANPGCIDALNCLPAPRGFRPLPGKTVVSDALASRPLGAASTTSPDSDVHLYAGTTTKLYSMTGAAWSDISQAGDYTNTAIRWAFAPYSEAMLATNYADYPQFIDMDAGALFADVTTDFKARDVAIIRDFAFFINTWDSTDGAVGNRSRWSGIGDYTDYTISATTQSDYQDTPEGGAAQRVFGGEYGVILFERAIYRVTYVGSPLVFQFDEVAPDIGLYTPGAAAQNGDDIFFLDNDGFKLLKSGQQVISIGNEKIDKWFWSTLDATQKDRISCAIDHENKTAVWAFPSSGNVSGKPNHKLIYDFELNRWSHSDIDSDLIFGMLSVGFTLETLDTLSSDLDTLTISIDSRLLFEGTKMLGVFDDFKLHALASASLEATFVTKEAQMFKQQTRSLVGEAWPLVDGSTVTIAIGTRNRQQDDVVWSAASAVNDVGFAPQRSEGRYHRAKMIVASDIWDAAQGVELKATRTGGR